MGKVDKHIFQSFWKTDDKEWMKQRRVDWKNIQLQLDRMRDNDNFNFNSMKKKNYKFYKSYFLTGKDKPDRPTEELHYCLWEHAPSNRQSYMLLQFWLCPDHSTDTLEYIKSSTPGGKADVKESKNYFENACIIYRRTCYCYSGKYKWTEEEGTTATNGPIFGDLEARMLGLFAYSTESRKKLDDLTSGNKRYFMFESVLLGFMGDFEPNRGVTVGYNPHNPIFNLMDEYMRWGFPRDHGESFHYDGAPVSHIIAYALIMYVVDTPDGRPKQQLEFAKELKQRITDGLPDMSEEAQTRWNTAEQFYKEGGLKTRLVNYQL